MRPSETGRARNSSHLFIHFQEFVMLGRKLVAAASCVVFLAGAASAQTSKSDEKRTEALIREAVERYAAGVDASRSRNAQEPAGGGASVPLTLEDAVRRAIDNNLEMAV